MQVKLLHIIPKQTISFKEIFCGRAATFCVLDRKGLGI